MPQINNVHHPLLMWGINKTRQQYDMPELTSTVVEGVTIADLIGFEQSIRHMPIHHFNRLFGFGHEEDVHLDEVLKGDYLLLKGQGAVRKLNGMLTNLFGGDVV